MCRSPGIGVIRKQVPRLLLVEDPVMMMSLVAQTGRALEHIAGQVSSGRQTKMMTEVCIRARSRLPTPQSPAHDPKKRRTRTCVRPRQSFREASLLSVGRSR